MTAEDAARLALVLLDELDSRWGEPPGREQLERLNGYIVAIEAADPTTPRVQYLYGRTWALMGRTGSAISALQRYVDSREGKNEWQAFRTLGDLFADEFPRMALSNYEKALALKPDDATVLMGMSRGYHGVGDRENALEYAKRAVTADRGQQVRMIAHLAKMYFASQQMDEADRSAMAALSKAQQQLEFEPGSRGALLLLQEQYDLLIGMLQARSASLSATAAIHARLARCMRERANVAEKLVLHDVLSLLDRAVQAAPMEASADVLVEYGITLAELGRTADAIATLEKALGVDPENSTAKDWLRRLSAPATTSSRP